MQNTQKGHQEQVIVFILFIINHLVKWLISYKKPLTRYICFVRKRWGEEKICTQGHFE
jgi:hypothetical protein